MSFSLRAALALRRRMGAKAGLAVLRPLVDQLQGRDRAEAILHALGCARELGDEASYVELTNDWATVNASQPFGLVAAEVRAARSLSAACARGLAFAETARAPQDARAHYLVARLGGDGSGASYAQALALAQRPPARKEYVAMIVASMLSDGHSVDAKCVGALSSEAIEGLPLRSRLAITRYRLGVSKGYKRLALIDSLLEVFKGGGPCALLALSIVAEFADGHALSTIEWDRLRTAAMTHGKDAAARFEIWHRDRVTGDGSTLGRAAMDAAAEVIHETPERTVEKGGSESWAWSPELQEAAQRAFEAIVALRKGSGEPDFASFAAARAPALVACALALDEGSAVAEALEFAEYLLAESQAKRGWLRLARAVRRRSATTLTTDLDTRLIERAFDRGEPGARSVLVAELKERAWAFARRGFREDDAAALSLLERARAMSL